MQRKGSPKTIDWRCMALADWRCRDRRLDGSPDCSSIGDVRPRAIKPACGSLWPCHTANWQSSPAPIERPSAGIWQDSTRTRPSRFMDQRFTFYCLNEWLKNWQLKRYRNRNCVDRMPKPGRFHEDWSRLFFYECNRLSLLGKGVTTTSAVTSGKELGKMAKPFRLISPSLTRALRAPSQGRLSGVTLRMVVNQR